MQYRIISVCQCWSRKGALERLAREVNEAIKQGWEPLGGVACNNMTYLQAMTKSR